MTSLVNQPFRKYYANLEPDCETAQSNSIYNSNPTCNDVDMLNAKIYVECSLSPTNACYIVMRRFMFDQLMYIAAKTHRNNAFVRTHGIFIIVAKIFSTRNVELEKGKVEEVSSFCSCKALEQVEIETSEVGTIINENGCSEG